MENGVRAGAEKIVSHLPRHLRARYEYVERPGKSRALNHVLDQIDRGLVVFFDDDVRLHPDVLLHYERAREAHEHAQRERPCEPCPDAASGMRSSMRGAGGGAYFGGCVFVDYEAPPPAWLMPHLPLSVRGFALEEPSYPYFLGANWAAYAQDVRQADGFREDIGAGRRISGDEKELQIRLERAGMSRIPVPAAQVWHYVPRTRCSPTWAIARQFEIGALHGLNVEDDPTVFGLPRHRARMGVRNVVRAVRRGAREEPRLWRIGYTLAYVLGLARGGARRLRRTMLGL